MLFISLCAACFLAVFMQHGPVYLEICPKKPRPPVRLHRMGVGNMYAHTGGRSTYADYSSTEKSGSIFFPTSIACWRIASNCSSAASSVNF